MKTIRLIVTLLVTLVMGYTNVLAATPTEKALLVLDNYTIPLNVKGAKVGGFVVSNDEAVVLLKDESGLFEVTKDNELKLKKNHSITSAAPIIYEVVVQYGSETKAFDIVKDEFIKNTVVAHRGGWRHSGATQNTLSSLKHAIELGCEGSEFDVWLSKDKKVVLNHDEDLEGKIVEKTTLADLRTVKLNKGDVVATLEEYIDLIKTQNKTRLVLELKSNKRNANILALTDSAVQIVHRMKAQAWVDYISFDYRGMKLVRAMDATAHIAFLEPSVDLDLQKLDGMSGIDYHQSNYDKIEKLHERCLMLGLTTNAWTVNAEEWMTRFLDMKLDFITTDEPEMLLKMIDARNASK